MERGLSRSSERGFCGGMLALGARESRSRPGTGCGMLEELEWGVPVHSIWRRQGFGVVRASLPLRASALAKPPSALYALSGIDSALLARDLLLGGLHSGDCSWLRPEPGHREHLYQSLEFVSTLVTALSAANRLTWVTACWSASVTTVVCVCGAIHGPPTLVRAKKL